MDKDTIINKHFQRAFLGYDVEEVDAFLDEVIRDLDRRKQELGVARLRIKILLEELENHGLISRRAGGAKKTEAVQKEETDASAGGNAESATRSAESRSGERNVPIG
jgi:DivIVA domain-containing protein